MSLLDVSEGSDQSFIGSRAEFLDLAIAWVQETWLWCRFVSFFFHGRFNFSSLDVFSRPLGVQPLAFLDWNAPLGHACL